VRACDVEPITYPSWDRDGNINGSVHARYVEAIAGDRCRVYGWMVWTHDPPAGPPVGHVTARPEVAPDPPDPRCPVAAGPKPPTTDTADAAGQLDGTATLNATVHPEGTPTTYRFEYGNDPSFGWVTEPRGLSNAMRTNPVSAQVGGLAPGATYHYRVVATGEHGTSAGPTRTFTMPSPPPPPPPPPPPEPVALSGLQVTPSPLKRSRHRLGTSAAIRYTLTKPATVTLSFTRATTGMLVGTSCRPAPRRGIPRGRKRCTLWTAVPGTLSQAAPAGQAKLRFGGWVGRRALAAGRYRVTALPADGGPAATPVVAGFRVRTR
jgi:hypothetical protein